jgi:pyruvate dehydrogenase (quinone)/pyruvate decarboxylase
MGEWQNLPERVEATARSPLRPQMVIRALSDLLADDAVISLDCGANTHFAARCLRLRANQRLTGTGMLASMAPGLPFAIAAQLAYPGRQSGAVVGDGGFAMLMAELTTAVANDLPVKIVLLKNNSLAEVMFEQREIGNPNYGCGLAPIDFVAFAKACGADGYRCESPDQVRGRSRRRCDRLARRWSKRSSTPRKSLLSPTNYRPDRQKAEYRSSRRPSSERW